MLGPIKKLSRLGQWNGRRRSSRSEVPVLPRVWQRPALVRLGVVLLAVATATLWATWWGAPLPYRVGEVCSPRTSLCGTGRSTIGQIGSPVARSKT